MSCLQIACRISTLRQAEGISSVCQAAIEDNLNFGNDVEKLERMMLTLNKGKGDDPEIKQLDGTLEKILDIQPDEDPEKARKRLKRIFIQMDDIREKISREH